MIRLIIVLSPAAIWALYRLIRYCMSIHKEMKILDKLNSTGVEHAVVTKDQIIF